MYEKLIQLSNSHGKEIEATMIDLVELNCSSDQKEDKIIDDQWNNFSKS